LLIYTPLLLVPVHSNADPTEKCFKKYRFRAGTSVADPGCFIPDPNIFPSRIPDLHNKRDEKSKQPFLWQITVSGASLISQKDHSSRIPEPGQFHPGS
jgi:hypothetical protein